jgi:hypothetical protein
MRIDTSVIRTAVFIGSASTGTFIPYGTGFVVTTRYDHRAFQTLVTAKHVIDDIPGDFVHVRVNQTQGNASIVAAPKSNWLAHPDTEIDVMVCPAFMPTDKFDLLAVDLIGPMPLSEASRQSEDVGVGDDVAIVGMFVSRLGERRNIPIVRSGTIAAMPLEHIKTQYGFHHAYLIESRSIDGLSGSPVFLQLPRERVTTGSSIVPSRRPLYLLGMMLGHHEVINARDSIEIRQQSGTHPPTENAVTARVLLNTGIGIVLPVSDLYVTVDQPLLINQRKTALQGENAWREYIANSVHDSRIAQDDNYGLGPT